MYDLRGDTGGGRMTARPSDRELLRWVVNAWDRLPARPTPLIRIVEDIRARLAEPEENVALVSIQVLEDFKTAREEITTLRARLAAYDKEHPDATD